MSCFSIDCHFVKQHGDCFYDGVPPSNSPKTCEECGFFKAKTNSSRIRAMSDEELAGWLERIRLYCATDLCGRSCPLAEVCYSNAEAPKETLDWLKQEVSE